MLLNVRQHLVVVCVFLRVTFLFFVPSALGPLIDSESDSSEDEGEISSPEVKALQAAASKVRTSRTPSFVIRHFAYYSQKRPAESPAKKPVAKVGGTLVCVFAAVDYGLWTIGSQGGRQGKNGRQRF